MTFRRSAFLVLIIFIALGGLFIGSEQHNAVVRAEGGTVIGTGTPASCQSSSAVNALASAVAAGGIIDFDCGPGPVTINVNTNVTTESVTINGGDLITLSGENLRQIFYVKYGGSVLLNDLQIQNGRGAQGGAIYIESGAAVSIYGSLVLLNNADSDGGAIYNKGNLTLNGARLLANKAQGAGGAIFNTGNVTIDQSDVSQNHAQWGGGIYNNLGQVHIAGTSIWLNKADVTAGGIYGDGPIDITNSTIARNSGPTGGGLYLNDDTTILNATIYKNQGNTGAGIWKGGSANVSLKNSIVAESYNLTGSALNLNCDGPSMTSLGRNIISDGSCVPNPGSNADMFNTDPDLADWEEAPTWGYVPNPASPVINYAVGCPDVDQRGLPRPVGGGCDVGSMELGWMVFLPVVVR